jgi:hypothetical protein
LISAFAFRRVRFTHFRLLLTAKLIANSEDRPLLLGGRLYVITPRAPETPTAPLRGGVTDWGGEEVRGCTGVPVGGVGLWRKFRHSGTNRDYDCGTNRDYDCGTNRDYDCGTNHYCFTNHYSGTDHYDCGTNHYHRDSSRARGALLV